jgi:hypothetical protein
VVLGASGPFGPDAQMGSFMMFLARCFSRGSMRITSTDPSDIPSVEMHQLSDRRDRVRARFALERGAEIAASGFADVVMQTPAARDGTTHAEILAMSEREFDEWVPKVGRDVATCAARAAWAPPTTSMPSSIPSAGSSAWRACAWSTRRSSRT